ncbi:MAG: glycosyltransferase family 4 protein [Nanoarchaeota archaeon]|nr:glycosyltransferase family 4 protein [Nanoarchaeota archaeon]
MTLTVCLRKGHHNVYDDLIAYPPTGVQYIVPPHVTQSSLKFVDSIKKQLFATYVHILNEPHSLSIPIPQHCQLIHATSGILIKNKFPWIIDAEHVASFCGFETGRLEKVRAKVEKLLSSPYCQKIMPWTEAAAQSIRNGLDTRSFEKKIEVVYPAIKPISIKKKKNEIPKLLFVSVRFFTKGGREVLEAFEDLQKKMDIELTIVSNVPEPWKKKYNDPSITYLPPTIPHETLLKEHFAAADVFVLPSYMDTFGMVFLEAMSIGLPIVSTNVFAIPEIVGKAGICINASNISWYGKDYLFAWNSWKEFSLKTKTQEKPTIVKQLVASLENVLHNKNLQKTMIKHGTNSVTKGKFSIKERNKKLKRIYEETTTRSSN